MRKAAVWVNSKGPRALSLAIKAGSFIFGVLILKHEAFDVKTVEPLLIFLGLWMCGVPPATFFDSIRRVGQNVDQGLSGHLSSIPSPEQMEPEPDKSVKKEPMP